MKLSEFTVILKRQTQRTKHALIQQIFWHLESSSVKTTAATSCCLQPEADEASHHRVHCSDQHHDHAVRTCLLSALWWRVWVWPGRRWQLCGRPPYTPTPPPALCVHSVFPSKRVKLWKTAVVSLHKPTELYYNPPSCYMNTLNMRSMNVKIHCQPIYCTGLPLTPLMDHSHCVWAFALTASRVALICN